MVESHLVMHGVAVKKHGTADAVAALVGLPVERVAALLETAVAGGRAALAGGKYLLTPCGRMIVEGQYSRYYAAARADAGMQAAHARFEVVNNELKQVITDWQTMAVGGQQVANDHADAAYDERVIDRLGQVHEKVEPILDAFATVVPRFARYKGALEKALERAEDGEHAWVSDATLDSYHTVWFELHEDILRVLGRTREE
ncbi:MAG: hypothetical protein AB7Q81_23390 [Gammaproteobacteria bacterium]